jgi:hypothetical protein
MGRPRAINKNIERKNKKKKNREEQSGVSAKRSNP